MATIRATKKNQGIKGTLGNDDLFGFGVTSLNYLTDNTISNDVLAGGGGNDTLYGGGGNDILKGDRGNDTLYGGTGNDILDGGMNDDMLWGGEGNDSLDGNGGNDRLNGGTGNNIVDGGTGEDTAVFTASSLEHQFSWQGNQLVVTGAGSKDTLKNIEFLFFDGEGDETYQIGGVIAQNDTATGTDNTENSLAIDVSSLLANDINLKLRTKLAITTDNSAKVGETEQGVSVYLTNGVLHFAQGETGYDFIAEDDTFTTSFTYTLNNGSRITDTATVSLTLTGTNDAAEFSGDLTGEVFVGVNGNSVTGDANHTDADAIHADDVFQVVQTANAEYGTYTVAANGVWTYTFLGEWDGEGFDSITLTNGQTLTDTLTLTAEDGTTTSVSVEIKHESVPDIDFEDLSINEEPLEVGYMGFNWSVPNDSLYVLDGDNYGIQESGYYIMGSNVAFTPSAVEPVTITLIDAGSFYFSGVDLTPAWEDSMQIQVRGYEDNELVAEQTVNLTFGQITTLSTQWQPIDRLEFDVVAYESDGGSGGSHLVLDNFYMQPVSVIGVNPGDVQV